MSPVSRGSIPRPTSEKHDRVGSHKNTTARTTTISAIRAHVSTLSPRRRRDSRSHGKIAAGGHTAAAMSHGDTIPLHSSSAQSDMDEIESLIHAAPPSAAAVLPARPPSPPRASIPVSSSPPLLPPPVAGSKPQLPPFSSSSSVASSSSPPLPSSVSVAIAGDGFGPPPNTLTEPVLDTVKRDLARIVSNLKLVVFPNPFREDPGKALRDWDLWGPFFFIVFLGLTLSWSASVKKVPRHLGI